VNPTQPSPGGRCSSRTTSRGLCGLVEKILFRNGNLTLALTGWWLLLTVGSVGVWGVWVGPGLVWMGCVVFAVALLWGGRLLAACHQSSNTVCHCW
jgi:hypothetical protein